MLMFFESCCGSSYLPPDGRKDVSRDQPRQLYVSHDGYSKQRIHEGLDIPPPIATTFAEETLSPSLCVEQAAEPSLNFQDSRVQDACGLQEEEMQSFVMWTADGEELVSFYIVDPGGPEETVATIAVPEGCAQKLNPKVLMSDSELAEVQGHLEDSRADATVMVELVEVPVQASAPSRIPFAHPWQPGMVTYNFMSGSEMANPCPESLRMALQELREARAQLQQQISKSTLPSLDAHEVMCPNQHKLKVRKASYASAWNCDSCKRRYAFNGSIRCQCRRCNYDLCKNCFALVAKVDPDSLIDLVRMEKPQPMISQAWTKTLVTMSKKTMLDAVICHNQKIAAS
eukprot:TRINITY_DN21960_c0_g1_i1.p1 TRINITY_DN21960_c0_g1~~TRINITY_DN21960_c0_g1_i1.p1  ORF type:complete len:343 (+),score=69.23 TRINITY_DN21960_c0_g1_i1:47-1075(+)